LKYSMKRKLRGRCVFTDETHPERFSDLVHG
jgi:hypothetical protein